MSWHNRRLGWRMPLQIGIREHSHRDTRQGLTFNLGPEGIYVHRLAGVADEGSVASTSLRELGLEFELPGISEVIWASAKVRHDCRDERFWGSGLRFTHLANFHRKMIYDYVREFRIRRLERILATVRRNRTN